MSLDLVLHSSGRAPQGELRLSLDDLEQQPGTLAGLVEVERRTPVMPDLLIHPAAGELLGILYPLDGPEMLAWCAAAQASFPDGTIERRRPPVAAHLDGYGADTELMLVRWARAPREAVEVAQIANDAWYAAAEITPGTAGGEELPPAFDAFVLWRLDRLLETHRLRFPRDRLL